MKIDFVQYPQFRHASVVRVSAVVVCIAAFLWQLAIKDKVIAQWLHGSLSTSTFARQICANAYLSCMNILHALQQSCVLQRSQ